jgi:hypothetical protein
LARPKAHHEPGLTEGFAEAFKGQLNKQPTERIAAVAGRIRTHLSADS